jgi:hypothetical protein
MKKSVQFFSEEYLKRCEGATPDQIIEFLENYRMLVSKDMALQLTTLIDESKQFSVKSG